MNKLISKIVGACLGLSLATGVGVGVAAGQNKEMVKAEAETASLIIDATELSLTSTATSAQTDIVAGMMTYTVSSGAKLQNSSGTNRFSDKAILIGKSGAYIYNKVAFPGSITKFEIYANAGASAKVSVGVSFGSSAITSWNATGAWTATLSTLNNVYDASSAITSGATYFRYQVTNDNNSQVQFRVTYENESGPSNTLYYARSPFSSTSAGTSVETVTVNSIEYTNYGGYNYSNQKALSFNRSINSYLGNKTPYAKCIDKIEILFTDDVSSKLTMYKGASTLAETTSIAPTLSNSNKTATYSFGGDSTFFKLKVTATGTYINIVYIAVYLADSAAPVLPDMKILNSNLAEGPFDMNYNASGLFYAYDATTDEQISSGLTWSVSSSSILSLTDVTTHCSINAVGIGQATLSVTKDGYNEASAVINVAKGTLTGISISGALSTSAYALNSSWSADGLVVTATYNSGYSETVTSGITWSFSPATPNSTSITSVVATASYQGKTASSGSLPVTVTAGATYNFTTNWATYAASWGGYASHVVTHTDVDADIAASITFTNASKQSGTITDRPVIAAKANTVSTMAFVLDSSVSASYNISSVSVAFAQWGTKKVCAAIYSGTSVSGTALDSFDDSGNPRTLTASNLNNDSFIVDFTTANTSNVQLGVTSITIGLVEKASYGTTHHISVATLPTTTIYHVGEEFSSAGLVVKAFDGSDEATATSKIITSDVVSIIDDGDIISDTDIPGFDVELEYEENSSTFTATYHVTVYALANYELVTEAPTDWSGNYILTSADSTKAMNGSLVSLDNPGNYKAVSANDGVITTGQEMEIVVSSFSSGYSIQVKNGNYIYGNSNSRLISTETEQYYCTFAYDSENEAVTITGGNSLHLVYSSAAQADRFAFYSGSSLVQLYKLVESDDASDYADAFLAKLSTGASAVCDADGDTDLADLQEAWALLASDFDALSASDKEQFRLGAASESGNNIQQALALYDYIVAKYGDDLESVDCDNYNFMSRTVSGARPMINVLNVSDNSEAVTAIVVVMALVITTAGAYFFLRKKKEN